MHNYNGDIITKMWKGSCEIFDIQFVMKSFNEKKTCKVIPVKYNI